MSSSWAPAPLTWTAFAAALAPWTVWPAYSPIRSAERAETRDPAAEVCSMSRSTFPSTPAVRALPWAVALEMT